MVDFIVAEHNVAVSLDRFKVVQGILLDLIKAPMAERDPFFHHAGTGVFVWLPPYRAAYLYVSDVLITILSVIAKRPHICAV